MAPERRKEGDAMGWGVAYASVAVGRFTIVEAGLSSPVEHTGAPTPQAACVEEGSDRSMFET